MRTMKWLAALALCFALAACSNAGGLMWSGSNNLDQETFTGDFDARFERLDGSYTLFEGGLAESRRVRIHCVGSIATSGTLGVAQVACVDADGNRTVLVDSSPHQFDFGIGMGWSSTWDDTVELPAGKNRITVAGNADGFRLELAIERD